MQPDNIHTSGQWSPGAGKSGYIPVLDGWRAVAIILVLLYHALWQSNLGGSPLLQQVLSGLDHLGPFGVLVFFTISGYLITGRLVADRKRTGKYYLGQFYVKRFFRILPLAYLYLSLVFLASFFHLIQLSPGDGWAWVFLSNYHPDRSWFTGHFWSLSVEEHFYLIWPPLLAFAGLRKGFWIGVALVLAEAVWRPWQLGRTTNIATALQRTDMRVDFLLIGALIAIAIVEWPQCRRWLAKLGSPLAALLLVVALGTSLLPKHFDTRTLQAILLAALVCGTSTSRSPLVQRLLANRFMLWIGQISYSIYILQQAVLGHTGDPWLNTPLAALMKMLLVVGLAQLSYRYVEQPFIRYARVLVRRSERVEVSSVAVAK